MTTHPYRVVQPWGKDRGRQATIISEHPTAAEAFAAIDRLAAQAERTGGCFEDDLGLAVADAEGGVVARPKRRSMASGEPERRHSSARAHGAATHTDTLVLCESSDGWSLHAPGSTDEAIASGDAPSLVSGEGQPTAGDYAAAYRMLDARIKGRPVTSTTLHVSPDVLTRKLRDWLAAHRCRVTEHPASATSVITIPDTVRWEDRIDVDDPRVISHAITYDDPTQPPARRATDNEVRAAAERRIRKHRESGG